MFQHLFIIWNEKMHANTLAKLLVYNYIIIMVFLLVQIYEKMLHHIIYSCNYRILKPITYGKIAKLINKNNYTLLKLLTEITVHLMHCFNSKS